MEADHLAIDSRADAQQGDAIVRQDVFCFQGQGHGEWQGRRARIAQPLDRGEIDLWIQVEPFEQQLAVGDAHLVANRLVDFAPLPTGIGEKPVSTMKAYLFVLES